MTASESVRPVARINASVFDIASDRTVALVRMKLNVSLAVMVSTNVRVVVLMNVAVAMTASVNERDTVRLSVSDTVIASDAFSGLVRRPEKISLMVRDSTRPRLGDLTVVPAVVIASESARLNVYRNVSEVVTASVSADEKV